MLATAEQELKLNLIYIFERDKTTNTHRILQITYNQTQMCTGDMLAHVHRHGCACTDTNKEHRRTSSHTLTHTQQSIVGKVGGQAEACMYVYVYYLLLYTVCVCI